MLRKLKNYELAPFNPESKAKWKPVPVQYDIMAADDMSGFIGLEELTDYGTIRGSVKPKSGHGKRVSNVAGTSKKKKSRVKKHQPDSPSRKRKLENSDMPEVVQTVMKKSKLKKIKGTGSVEARSKNEFGLKKRKLENTVVSLTEDVQLENKNGLEDMQAWSDLYVPEPVLQALREQGFYTPTAIQIATLPSAIRDRLDILGAAQTGSGKTLAFGIPILHYILEELSKQDTERKKLRALIITPTRELAIQVQHHLQAAAKYTAIKVAVVVGGMAPQKQLRVLRHHPDIVVATPGRLWELIEEGNEHLNDMSHLHHLVIDEADRMTEKGHFTELEQIVEHVKRNGNENRQTYVFSATLTMIHETPKRLRFKKKKVKLTQEIKLESIMTLVGMQKKPKVIDLSTKTGTVDTLTESRIYCEPDEKDAYLYYFWLKHPGRTLVFCNSIDTVRRLQALFELLNCKPLCLHANMQQRQRLKNLDRFTKREQCLLFASDVAARGLDIPNIQHVVHYQIPRTAEVYVHRSGRTARAQNKGLSLALISTEEVQLHRKLAKTLNRGDLADFGVDSGFYKSLLERVNCAHQLDKLLHQHTKAHSQNRWLQQAAEAFEVDIEEDQELAKIVGKSSAVLRQKKDIQMLKKKLSGLLKKTLKLPGFFNRYPTQSGTLKVPALR